MKKMKIEIKSKQDANAELFKMAKNFDSKKKNQKIKNQTYFESLAVVRKVLTDKRLEVWRAIRDNKPSSITELANELERDFRAVHRDVLILSKIGLIQMKSMPGEKGNRQQLTSNYNELLLAVA